MEEGCPIKKKVSRTNTRIVAIILPLAVLFAIFHLFMHFDNVYRIVAGSIILLGLLLNLKISRCPYCKKFGLKLHPFAKDAGYCKYCGELVEFDR